MEIELNKNLDLLINYEGMIDSVCGNIATLLKEKLSLELNSDGVDLLRSKTIRDVAMVYIEKYLVNEKAQNIKEWLKLVTAFEQQVHMSHDKWKIEFSNYFFVHDSDDAKIVENLQKLRTKYKRRYSNFITNLANNLRLLCLLLV